MGLKKWIRKRIERRLERKAKRDLRKIIWISVRGKVIVILDWFFRLVGIAKK